MSECKQGINDDKESAKLLFGNTKGYGQKNPLNRFGLHEELIQLSHSFYKHNPSQSSAQSNALIRHSIRNRFSLIPVRSYI